MTPITILLIALLATYIGALPLGLVNLTVLNVAQTNGKQMAMKIAHGAALIEVVFGVVALYAGSYISDFTQSFPLFNRLILLFPAVIALVFFVKKNPNKTKNSEKQSGFLKGIILNLISVQVLLYWMFALMYIHTRWHPEYNSVSIILFVLGIWLGKISVLWMYSSFSKVIRSKSDFLSRHINQIIGAVLLLSVVVQVLKYS